MAQGDYSAAVYDVVMQQNDTFSEQFVLRDTDGGLLALGGYTFASQVRQTAAGALVASMTLSVDTDTATVTRTMGTAVTSGIAPGQYVHDMHWVDPDGDVRTLIAGRFTVKADVTRV
jgi:hypothetical protein